MNTFLQGCCFIPPDDDSIPTPSFRTMEERLTQSSRPSSKAESLAKLDDKEIIYIKPYPGDAWADLGKETCVYSNSSKASSGVVTRSSKSASSSRQRYKGCSKASLIIVPDDKFEERVPCYLCQSRKTRTGSSSYVSAYEPTSPHAPTSTNKLLDFISMCLWKCTPGCQQIPALNT